MSSREPFFEPPRHEQDVADEPRRYANLPWSPPLNVVPVVVPIEVHIAATSDVVMRLMDAQAFDRGMVLRVEAWVHPDAADRAQGRHGLPVEAQIGLLLADGTKLGAGGPEDAFDAAPHEAGTPAAPVFTPIGGMSGDLRAAQNFWIAPIPPDAAELVVAWSALGVAETFLPLDLDEIRTASARAKELWPLPDATEQTGGWFGHSSGGHAAYTSTLSLAFDDEGDQSDDHTDEEE